jgi:putative alpha-1,2-mannosidase
MMGFYPITPGDPVYTLASPVFDKVTIHLDKHYYAKDKIIIEAINNSPENIYIQKMEMDGQALNKFFISHEALVNQQYFKFYLGPTPKK